VKVQPVKGSLADLKTHSQAFFDLSQHIRLIAAEAAPTRKTHTAGANSFAILIPPNVQKPSRLKPLLQ
jgi:hypothetical protein